MDRIFLGGALVCVVVGGRLIFLPEASAWGPVITFGAVVGFLVLMLRTIGNQPGVERVLRDASYSDPDGPNQGWDPKVVEAARRRAEGIE